MARVKLIGFIIISGVKKRTLVFLREFYKMPRFGWFTYLCVGVMG